MAAALRQTNLTGTVLDQLRSLQKRIDRILTKAEQAEDLPTAVRAAHEARETLMGIARLTGEDRSTAKAEQLTVEVVYVDAPLTRREANDTVIESPVIKKLPCPRSRQNY
jgi:hypothetical protein